VILFINFPLPRPEALQGKKILTAESADKSR
jgi:hypothetical protein